MGHGGAREGAGRKGAWRSGDTVAVRIPEALKDQVLAYARQLDQDNPAPVAGQLSIYDAPQVGKGEISPAAHLVEMERRARAESAAKEAAQLLREHLAAVDRKGTLKRSVIREALALLESVT